jgi:hypothetical protein
LQVGENYHSLPSAASHSSPHALLLPHGNMQGAPSLSIHGVSSPSLGRLQHARRATAPPPCAQLISSAQRYSFLSMAGSSREPPAAMAPMPPVFPGRPADASMAELLGSTLAPCSSPWPSPLVRAPLPLGRCPRCVCGVAGRSSSHGHRRPTLLHGRRPAARLFYSPSHGAPIPSMENQQPPPPQLCSTLSSQMAPGVSSRLPRTTLIVPPFLFPHGSSRKPWVTPSLHLPLFPPLDAFHG